MNSTWLLAALCAVVLLLNLFFKSADSVDQEEDPPLYWLIMIFNGGLVAALIAMAVAGY